MIQRVLVLGSNGFIGRRVVSQLSRLEGINVIAAGRTPISLQPAQNTSNQLFDATDASAMRLALAGVDGVINCIAGDPRTIVASAQTLFATAAQVRPSPRIVHVSSLAVYGTVDGLVDETMPARGDSGAYSAAKLATEKLSGQCVSAVTVRPGIVYGPRSPWWSDRIARLLCAKRLGHLGDDGEGICNAVYVDDVATAIVRALCTAGIEGQTFNLGFPSSLTWNAYFARYARALGAIPVKRISRSRLMVEQNLLAPPLKLLELAGRFPPLGAAMLPPPIRPWLLTLCKHRLRMLVTRAETMLGMQWTELDDGLKSTADWFLAGARY